MRQSRALDDRKCSGKPRTVRVVSTLDRPNRPLETTVRSESRTETQIDAVAGAGWCCCSRWAAPAPTRRSPFRSRHTPRRSFDGHFFRFRKRTTGDRARYARRGKSALVCVFFACRRSSWARTRAWSRRPSLGSRASTSSACARRTPRASGRAPAFSHDRSESRFSGLKRSSVPGVSTVSALRSRSSE